MARIKTQVKASTLLEVMMAMMVVMLVFGLAMTLFVRIGASQRSALKVQAQAEMQRKLLDMEQNQRWLDEEYETDQWRMVVVVRSMGNAQPDLQHVHIETYASNGFLLGRRDQLIYQPDEN